MSVTVICNLTLDGVMQAPGRPDEDVRDGFEHGGWARPYADDAMGRVLASGTGGGASMLFGRRTYEDFAAFWPAQRDGNPFTEVLDRTTKYVASRTLTEPLTWQNSTLLPGDAAAAVTGLSTDLVVLGSGELVRSLTRRGLVDTYVLLIHPLVLGSGRTLFADDTTVRLRLLDSVATTTGVVIATYEPNA